MTAFYEANLTMTRPDPPFNFYDRERPIYTRSRFLPPSRIDQCRLEPAIVTEGCWLNEAEVTECVIGLRSVVRPGAPLKQVVMMGADFYQTPEEKAEARSLGQPRLGIGRERMADQLPGGLLAESAGPDHSCKRIGRDLPQKGGRRSWLAGPEPDDE